MQVHSYHTMQKLQYTGRFIYYRKSVLRKRMCHVRSSRCSTELRLCSGHPVQLKWIVDVVDCLENCLHLYSLRVEHDEAAGEGHGGHHPQHEIDCVGRQSHLPLHLGAVPAHTRTGIEGANGQQIVVKSKA